MANDRAMRPNVIVVLTDQQRWDTTGIHGNPLHLTPTFDEMAYAGTHVAQAFTPNPVCAPARAALQTGQYGTTTGCFRNDLALPEHARTLAHEFGEAGYATGYIGKWHLAGTEPAPPHERGGYQTWLGANIMEFTSDAYHTILFDEEGDPVMLPGYRSDAVFDAAIRFVADHAIPPGSVNNSAPQPFYLFCSLVEPHHQNEVDTYPAPAGYAERYRGRWLPPDLAALATDHGAVYQQLGGYCGQVRRVDEGLGRLLDALRSLDLLDSTIVAFTADHGCHFRTRNREYKRSCHDCSIRVPLALGGPGFDGGGRIDRPASLIDLPPTLLDAAGIEVPSRMQGRSFLPLVHDNDAEWPDEVFVQVSESEIGRTIRTGRWKYHVVAPDGDPWHDSAASRYVESELYDLANDPYELENLAGAPSHRGIAEQLHDRLLERMADAGEPLPVIEPAPPRPAKSQRRAEPTVYAGDWRPTRFGHQPKGVNRTRDRRRP